MNFSVQKEAPSPLFFSSFCVVGIWRRSVIIYSLEEIDKYFSSMVNETIFKHDFVEEESVDAQNNLST